MVATRTRTLLYSPVVALSHWSSAASSLGVTSYRATKTCCPGSSTRVGSGPSQPSPPKVIRQPGSQPVPRRGECGQRRAIWWGSRLLPYAAYSTTGGYLLRLDGGRWKNRFVTRVVIIGGGPGGYEAALVGSQLGGEGTLIDTHGPGGAGGVTDWGPSTNL